MVMGHKNPSFIKRDVKGKKVINVVSMDLKPL